MVDWQPVAGSAGYEVSSAGEVRRGNRLLKPYATRGGYLLVGIDMQDGTRRRHLVHRLVMQAFVGPCPEGQECCHGNGVRDDNRIANLRYAPRIENMRDQYRHGTRVSGSRVASSKLTAADVRTIRARASEGVGIRTLAREYGVSHTAVAKVVSGKAWSSANGE